LGRAAPPPPPPPPLVHDCLTAQPWRVRARLWRIPLRCGHGPSDGCARAAPSARLPRLASPAFPCTRWHGTTKPRRWPGRSGLLRAASCLDVSVGGRGSFRTARGTRSFALMALAIAGHFSFRDALLLIALDGLLYAAATWSATARSAALSWHTLPCRVTRSCRLLRPCAMRAGVRGAVHTPTAFLRRIRPGTSTTSCRGSTAPTGRGCSSACRGAHAPRPARPHGRGA
jgi:hypothetical protein